MKMRWNNQRVAGSLREHIWKDKLCIKTWGQKAKNFVIYKTHYLVKSLNWILCFRNTRTRWAFHFWRHRPRTLQTSKRPSWRWQPRSKTEWARPHPQDPPDKSKSSRHQCNPKADQDVVEQLKKKPNFFPKKAKNWCVKMKLVISQISPIFPIKTRSSPQNFFFRIILIFCL